MKLLVLCLTALLCIQLALAAPAEGKDTEKVKIEVETVLSICDIDLDGIVSNEELEKGKKNLHDMMENVNAIFEAADKNADKKISKAEVKALEGLPKILISLTDIDDEMISLDELKKVLDKLEKLLENVAANIENVDEDKNGKLNKDELVKLLENLNEKEGKTVADQIIGNFDVNNDNSLSKGEMKNAFETITNTLKHLKTEFNAADRSKDGKLDKNEVRQALMKYHGGYELLEKILSNYDTNKDGISLDEMTKAFEDAEARLTPIKFEEADTNNDGKLDKAELEKVSKK